jgi:hypothetical protein
MRFEHPDTTMKENKTAVARTVSERARACGVCACVVCVCVWSLSMDQITLMAISSFSTVPRVELFDAAENSAWAYRPSKPYSWIPG